MTRGYVFRLSTATSIKSFTGVVVVFVGDTGVQIWRRKVDEQYAEHLADAVSASDAATLVDLLIELLPDALINHATKDLWRLGVVNLGHSDSERLTFVENRFVTAMEPSAGLFRYHVDLYFNLYRDEDRRRQAGPHGPA